MCGPCSDGTYWNRDNYNRSYKIPEPSKYVCNGCDVPVNWCHCELSSGRVDIYDSAGKTIVRRGDKYKNAHIRKNASNN